MNPPRRPAARRLVLPVLSVVVAVMASLMVTTTAQAADGPQTAPTLAPSPVPTAADTFALGNGSCDGTGGAGWRVQTFIVNAGVDLSTLVFDQGPFFDRVGSDRDNSDGTIRSPLWKGAAPGTGYNPAASPAGLINPVDLASFSFDGDGWVLPDGQYQIGYACLDELTTLRQWWSLTVTIDADASPGPFMSIATDPVPEDTSVALSASPTSSTVGDSVTFTATVTPSSATGNVQFRVGGVTQATSAASGGTATWTTSALTQGTKSVTAVFAPTDTSAFNGSTSTPLSFVVSPASAQATTLTLTADPASPAIQFQLVELTATVTPSAAAGTVTFTADGEALAADVPVAGGVATTSGIFDTVGPVALAATFTPTSPAAFTGSTDTLDYEVIESPGDPTTVELASDPAGAAKVGDAVTFTATVEPAVAGAVGFLDGGELLGDPVEVLDGVATLTTSDLAAGDHEITAAFIPEDLEANAPSASDPLSLTVTATDPPPPSGTDGTTDGITDGVIDGSTEVAGSGSLPITGYGVGIAGLGLVLVYVGRVLYLVGRPQVSRVRR